MAEELHRVTGSWPADEGNRSAPRQKKWYKLYQRIEKCPMMQHGQKSLFGAVRRCLCGFHIQKQPSSTSPEASAAGAAHAAPTPQMSAAGPAHAAPTRQTSAAGPAHAAALGQVQGAESHKRQPPLNLSMFIKPRFSGEHLAAAKAILARARPRNLTQPLRVRQVFAIDYLNSVPARDDLLVAHMNSVP
ncbi:hypothetical protein CHARACLAT_032396, partial [Characodon lateralis]|nr:hypothetical protein [Characodon lateralis]